MSLSALNPAKPHGPNLPDSNMNEPSMLTVEAIDLDSVIEDYDAAAIGRIAASLNTPELQEGLDAIAREAVNVA